MHIILGIIGTIIVIAMHIAADDAHRKQYGVGLPSKNARRRIRKNATRKGISEFDAHEQWVRNKHRWQRTSPPPYIPPAARRFEVDLPALERAIQSNPPIPPPAEPHDGPIPLLKAAVFVLFVGAILAIGSWLASPKVRPDTVSPAPASIKAPAPVSAPASPEPEVAHKPVLSVFPPPRPAWIDPKSPRSRQSRP